MKSEIPTTAPFMMHGARAAIDAGMKHIEKQVEAIERAVSENTGLAFDLSKTLIESVCRSILTERSFTFDQNDDLSQLFKKVTKILPFLPPSASGLAPVRKTLVQILGGLHTALKGVCELRNACGFASHGSDGPRPAMETVQAFLAAETADAIVGFLHRIHSQNRLPDSPVTLQYAHNSDFNEYIDEMHKPIQIFESLFRPSEVLFLIEPETYRSTLAAYQIGQSDGNE